MGSIFTISILQSALELGFIYSLVVLALFVSFSILNIADLSTDGCFTLGCAVAASVTISGHPILALFMAMGAGIISGFITAFLQTRINTCRYYCKYGIVYNKYCCNGIFVKYESV